MAKRPVADSLEEMPPSPELPHLAESRPSSSEPKSTGLPAALQAVRGLDPSGKLAGIASLGAIGGEAAIAELRGAAQREGEIYQAAAVAELGKLQDWPAVRQATFDKSWRVRRAAVAALVADQSSSGREAVMALLDDRSSAVQREVVAAARTWPLESAGPLLLAGLESPTYATRVAALEALQAIWPPAQALSPVDLQPLVPPRAKLDSLQAAWKAKFGAESLASLDRRQMREPIPAASANPAALHAPPGFEPADPATLTMRLGSGDKHSRLAAAAALARLGYASGISVLEGFTFDSEPEIRRAAATAIGTLDDPFFLPMLVRLLDDEPAVRLAALNSLPRTACRDEDEDAGSLTAAARAERWQAWYSQGGDRR